MKSRLYVALCLGLFLPFCRSNAAEPRLTKHEVIRLADAAGKQSGHAFGHYTRSAPRYESVPKDQTWTVFYQGNPNREGRVVLGDYFIVILDDRSKKIRVVEGR